MKPRHLRIAAVAVAISSVAATGCILGSDPNKNSTRFGALGGSTGGAGNSGAGGGGGSGPNGPVIGTGVALFDTTVEGFMLDDAPNTGQRNLNDRTNPAVPPPTLAFDGTQGSPLAGSLTTMVPFSGANQLVDIQKIYGATDMRNWSGKTLHVRVKVTSGAFAGGVQVFVKTGLLYVFGGTYTPFTGGSNWQEFTLNLANPVTLGTSGTYDPSQVVSFGIELNSSGAGTNQMPVTLNIDSFSVDPPLPGVDAGMDAGASPDAGTDTPAPTDTAPSDTAPSDTAAPTDTAAPSDTAPSDASGN